jgi:RimJ/RimL family protein N-acetyltransferase
VARAGAVGALNAPIVRPDPLPTDGVVTLRPWAESDLPELVACFADEQIARWLPLIPHPYTQADAREWFATHAPRWATGAGAAFAIVDAVRGEVLGGIGMRAQGDGRFELGYWVRRERRGEGVATRALRLISGWAIEAVGAERLQLHADVENVASQRVAERAGYTREGILRSWLERHGERRDHVLYSLLPNEWRTQTFGS